MLVLGTCLPKTTLLDSITQLLISDLPLNLAHLTLVKLGLTSFILSFYMLQQRQFVTITETNVLYGENTSLK